MKKSVFVLSLAMVLAFSGSSWAILWDRGGGMIYDDFKDITWLQDANYAATELSDARVNEIINAVGSVGVDFHPLTSGDFEKDPSGNYTGRMTWWGATAWADQLVYGVYDDWRLPTMDESPEELMWFWRELIDAHWPDSYTGPFVNVQEFIYWSGTEIHPWARSYDLEFGTEYTDRKANNFYAIAVRDGDVGAPVPEPGTMLLFGTGLGGLAAFRRRFRQ